MINIILLLISIVLGSTSLRSMEIGPIVELSNNETLNTIEKRAEHQEPMEDYFVDRNNNKSFNYYYPSPMGGRIENVWQQAFDSARKIVNQMSVLEKVNLTTGTGWGSGKCIGNTGSVPRFGIPNLCLQDGPNGVRFADFITHFPSGLASGSTFNKNLIYLRGKALGREHRKKGVHIMLGPTVGPIGLKAAGGRNWEGFGADPYLQGIAGAATVEGIQEEGVIATVRHLVGNEQEHFRQVGEWKQNGWEVLEASISSNIGDREMHEIYLWPFADTIRSGVGSVMCSYNQINNSYACENSYLLNYLLKEELGFQGFVMSDWGAQHTGVHSALSGLDMTMPGEIFDDWLSGMSNWGPLLTQAVYNHSVPQDRLTDMATRILAPFFAIENVELPSEYDLPNFSSWTYDTYGQQYPFQNYGPEIKQNWHKEARSKLSDEVAYNISKEAIVLLKNQDNVLPINKENGIRRIFLAGVGAGPDAKGFSCKEQACVDGVLTSGWGSPAVDNPYIVTPYEAISKQARKNGIILDYSTEVWNFDSVDEIANRSDLSIVVVNAASGEGYVNIDENYGDRKNLSLWHNGDELIRHVANKSRTIVVVNSVGPVNMESWIDHENVVGVLYTAPLGQFVGQAIADVCFGLVNPSGKLPFTIAKNERDYVPIIDDLSFSANPQDNFDRGIYLDYRFFDKHGIRPRYEFGFGLSFTNFTISGLNILEISPPSEFLPYPSDYLVHLTKDDDVCDPIDALFPHSEFEPVPGYIYPYLFDEDVGFSTRDSKNPQHKSKAKSHPPVAGGGLGGNPALWEVLYEVRANITNSGTMEGAYVAQLYIEFPNTLVNSPPKVLRGFDKVYLQPGESELVKFNILHRDISIWDIQTQQWIIQTGSYKIYISSSSRKVELCGEVEIVQ